MTRDVPTASPPGCSGLNSRPKSGRGCSTITTVASNAHRNRLASGPADQIASSWCGLAALGQRVRPPKGPITIVCGCGSRATGGPPMAQLVGEYAEEQHRRWLPLRFPTLPGRHQITAGFPLRARHILRPEQVERCGRKGQEEARAGEWSVQHHTPGRCSIERGHACCSPPVHQPARIAPAYRTIAGLALPDTLAPEEHRI